MAVGAIKPLEFRLVQAREMNRLRSIETDDFQIAAQCNTTTRTVRERIKLLGKMTNETIYAEVNLTDGMRQRRQKEENNE